MGPVLPEAFHCEVLEICKDLELNTVKADFIDEDTEVGEQRPLLEPPRKVLWEAWGQTCT
jgi:hypothetical protein